ncbi:MAG: hypothetical protein DMG49_23205 [Acidobacteria bacterium]|nr:MAG: hypothetical protein DMG49_23205 [Acidobacteriota bacterium]
MRGRRNFIGPLRWVLQGALLLSVSLQPAGLARGQEPGPAAKCSPAARIDPAKGYLWRHNCRRPLPPAGRPKSPESRAWIDAQQKYTEGILSRLAGGTELSKRLTDLLCTDSFQWAGGTRRALFFPQAVRRPGALSSVAAVSNEKSLFYPTFAGDRFF